MKHLFPLAICFLLFASFINKDQKAICSVKYNGIYAFKLDNENSAVIRFYKDGTVLASTSLNDYMDVFSWFHKDNKDMVLTGKYKTKNCSIKFDVAGMTGKQSYNGSIDGDKLIIKLSDEKSKKSVSRIYTFFAL